MADPEVVIRDQSGSDEQHEVMDINSTDQEMASVPKETIAVAADPKADEPTIADDPIAIVDDSSLTTSEVPTEATTFATLPEATGGETSPLTVTSQVVDENCCSSENSVQDEIPIQLASSDGTPIRISTSQIYLFTSGQDSARVPTKASKKAFVPEGVKIETDEGMVVRVETDESEQQIVIQQSSEASGDEQEEPVEIPDDAQVEEIGAEELEREFQTQSAQKAHQCHTCGETFFMYLELLRHVMSAHSSSLPPGHKSGEIQLDDGQDQETTLYECSECKLRFKKVVHLNEHIAMHFAVKAGSVVESALVEEPPIDEGAEEEEEVKAKTREQGKKFSCEQCNKKFTRSFSLKSHMLVHEGVKPFPCEICSKTFREQAKLKNHMAVHADAKPHICAICAKAFAAAAYLRTHMMIHTGKKPYKCTECDMAFISSGNLKRHMRVHTGEKPFNCDFCGASFAQMGNLESHKRTHTGVRPYECEICGKGFMQSSGLVEHIRTHSGAKPYTCDVCGRSFAGSSGLRVHKRTHTGEKPHECDICLKRFAASGNLKTHMKIHLNQRPFKCEYCGKSFVASGNLSQHVRIHTGEKPYKCNICEKAFVGSGGLKIHMMGHYDEKPFMCEYCEKGFKTKQKLVAHTRAHTGERPFACSFCQKTFTVSEKLKAHLRKQHQVGLKEPAIPTPRPGREPADYEDLGPPVLSPQSLEPIPRVPPPRTVKHVQRPSPGQVAERNTDEKQDDPYHFDESENTAAKNGTTSTVVKTPMDVS